MVKSELQQIILSFFLAVGFFDMEVADNRGLGTLFVLLAVTFGRLRGVYGDEPDILVIRLKNPEPGGRVAIIS